MGFDASVQDLENLPTSSLQDCKKVIVELRPTTEEHHLLVELKEEETLKRILEKRSTNNVIEEAAITESQSSLEFEDVCYAGYCPTKKGP